MNFSFATDAVNDPNFITERKQFCVSFVYNLLMVMLGPCLLGYFIAGVVGASASASIVLIGLVAFGFSFKHGHKIGEQIVQKFQALKEEWRVPDTASRPGSVAWDNEVEANDQYIRILESYKGEDNSKELEHPLWATLKRFAPLVLSNGFIFLFAWWSANLIIAAFAVATTSAITLGCHVGYGRGLTAGVDSANQLKAIESEWQV
jgi:hypothetical protein